MVQGDFQATIRRKPYAFLVVSFALLLKPSTIAAEISPRARNRSRMWSACPAFLATTLRYGFHMSLQMNASAAVRFAEPAEEPEQRLGASVLADPQQALARRVDLVDEREEIGARAANGFHRRRSRESR